MASSTRTWPLAACTVGLARSTRATTSVGGRLGVGSAALAPKLAREQGADNGFRTVINTGRDGGQEVYHLHVHVMGGPRPWKHG